MTSIYNKCLLLSTYSNKVLSQKIPEVSCFNECSRHNNRVWKNSITKPNSNTASLITDHGSLDELKRPYVAFHRYQRPILIAFFQTKSIHYTNALSLQIEAMILLTNAQENSLLMAILVLSAIFSGACVAFVLCSEMVHAWKQLSK